MHGVCLREVVICYANAKTFGANPGLASLEKIIKHKKRPIGSFSCLVISAGVEPALTGWKPVVLTVILRDQFRNVLLYYNRFKKIGNSYFYKIHLLHLGIVHTDWLIYFFRLKTWLKLFLYLLTAQNRIRCIVGLSKWRMRLKCHRRQVLIASQFLVFEINPFVQIIFVAIAQ